MLICCSEYEGGPLGIFEAAASGRAVMTTEVGNSKHIKGIKMFDTVCQAAAMIQLFNDNPQLFSAYQQNITDEVRLNWDMKSLIRTHFLPIVENHC
jgi:glycosyltransferase involved in cell wall biosynthesis